MCCADFNFYINRQGIQGRKGEKGDTGFSPTISVGTDTLDEYKLIIANESNSFETPNLRGNINIQDNGGTYLRYDTETKQISAQSIDAATADTLGGVRLSTEADIVEMGAGSVVTPSDVADALPLYLEGEGAVTITQDELTSKTKIKVDIPSVNDLESRMSTAEAEIADIQTDVANLDNNKVAKTDLATTESAGIVKVDGTTIFSAADGTISAISGGALPIASTTQLGGVKVDGTSIIADENGVISSVGGGGTGDVTASGNNVFTGDNKFKRNVTIDCDASSGNALILHDSFANPYDNYATLRMGTDGNLTIDSEDGGLTLDTYLSKSKIDMTKNGDIYFTSEKPLMHRNFQGSGTDVPLVNQANIKAGENITLNKNAETGDITISSTGGGGGTGDVPIATTEVAGKVKPDGTTITITDDGTISANSSYTLPTASTTQLGGVKVDGTSVTINSDGVISATGGGSTPTNMVTTDTDQTINGSKTFANRLGTVFTGTSSNSDSLIIDGDDKEIRFNSASHSPAVIKNQGLTDVDLNIGANFNSVKITTTLYDKNGNEIVGGGSSGDVPIATTATAGKVKPDGTTITVTDDGTISAVPTTPSNMVTTDTSQTISGAKTFTQPTVFKDTLDMSTGGTDTLYIYANGSYAEGYTTDIKYDKNLNIKGSSSGGTLTLAPYNSSLNALKYKNSDRTDNPSYDILHTGNLVTGNNITISEPNSTGVRTISGPSNERMAHMAMPSGSYVDLTLGASGAAYTAPTDGWLCFAKQANAANQRIALFNAGSQSDTMIGSCVFSSGNGQGLHAFVPAKKGDKITIIYSADGQTAYFRFIYAVGSVPTT